MRRGKISLNTMMLTNITRTDPCWNDVRADLVFDHSLGILLVYVLFLFNRLLATAAGGEKLRRQREEHKISGSVFLLLAH